MAATEGSDGSTTKRPRVLIVDDDQALLATVSAILEDDYEVVSATSGAEALEKFRTEHFDAVASDFLMPKMNGIELLIELARRRPELVSVLMTGYRDFTERSEGRDKQRPTYFLLTKPFHPALLLSTLERAISLTRLKRQAASLAGKGAPSSSEPRGLESPQPSGPARQVP